MNKKIKIWILEIEIWILFDFCGLSFCLLKPILRLLSWAKYSWPKLWTYSPWFI